MERTIAIRPLIKVVVARKPSTGPARINPASTIHSSFAAIAVSFKPRKSFAANLGAGETIISLVDTASAINNSYRGSFKIKNLFTSCFAISLATTSGEGIGIPGRGRVLSVRKGYDFIKKFSSRKAVTSDLVYCSGCAMIRARNSASGTQNVV